MQECPGSPRGVIYKELNSKPQTEDPNNSSSGWVCEWVFAGGLVTAEMRVFIWKGADW